MVVAMAMAINKPKSMKPRKRSARISKEIE